MRITPISAEQADSQSFEPWRAGDYDFIVREAVEGFSKAGNEQIVLTLGVFNQAGDERKVYDYLANSEKAAWKIRRFAAATGMLRQYDAGEMSPLEMINRPGRCKLRVEPAGQFPAKNSVADYLAKQQDDPMPAAVSRSLRPAEARKPVPAGAGGGDLDDEIPFGPSWQ